MDHYEASVKSVDDAIARLQSTLASCNIGDAAPQRSGKPDPRLRAPRNTLNFRRNDLGEDIEAATAKYQPLLWERYYILDAKLSAWEYPNAEARVEWLQWEDVVVREYAHFPPGVQREELCKRAILEGVLYLHTCSIEARLELAKVYRALGYPDLATGEAYKALLLVDSMEEPDTMDGGQTIMETEFTLNALSIEDRNQAMAFVKAHENDSVENPLTFAMPQSYGPRVKEVDQDELDFWKDRLYRRLVYIELIKCLLLCGDLKAAGVYMNMAFRMYSQCKPLLELRSDLHSQVSLRLGKPFHTLSKDERTPSNWPSRCLVRREVYPWNDTEPDRTSDLDKINAMMREVAPNLEVRRVKLPDLTGIAEEDAILQLGVYATKDMSPGDVILDERSILAVNNRLQDSLCDCCSSELPAMNMPGFDAIESCPECEACFCNDYCLTKALLHYHPAVCGLELEASLADPRPEDAADNLYTLLLLRALAMSWSRDRQRPLELDEVRYIWGDFHTLNHGSTFRAVDDTKPETAFAGFPRSLPWTFEHNVRLPLEMLQKMDVLIFASWHQSQIWVINTLYAKFRGTASARLSGAQGSAARGPEVAAVHPMWCLANHSCDPNVSWEWGGSIKFTVKTQRAEWKGRISTKVVNSPGVKAGEEILSHYCDIDLPVQERREWAKGSLGGDCRCDRCLFESSEEQARLP